MVETTPVVSEGTLETPETLPEPAWDVATLFPRQGAWSEHEYLHLTNTTNRLVELSEGHVEVLPVPTQYHQLVVLALYRLLFQVVRTRALGTLLVAPLRVRLWEGKFREPDLVFMLAQHDQRRHDDYWQGADLVVEVVSTFHPERDLVTKREEYARAGIAEYWIVHLQDETVTVLYLHDNHYVQHGHFERGMVITSVVLKDVACPVNAVFDTT